MIFPIQVQAVLQFLCLFLAAIVAMGDVLPHPWGKITGAFVSALQAAMGLYGHTRDRRGHALEEPPPEK